MSDLDNPKEGEEFQSAPQSITSDSVLAAGGSQQPDSHDSITSNLYYSAPSSPLRDTARESQTGSILRDSSSSTISDYSISSELRNATKQKIPQLVPKRFSSIEQYYQAYSSAPNNTSPLTGPPVNVDSDTASPVSDTTTSTIRATTTTTKTTTTWEIHQHSEESSPMDQVDFVEDDNERPLSEIPKRFSSLGRKGSSSNLTAAIETSEAAAVATGSNTVATTTTTTARETKTSLPPPIILTQLTHTLIKQQQLRTSGAVPNGQEYSLFPDPIAPLSDSITPFSDSIAPLSDSIAPFPDPTTTTATTTTTTTTASSKAKHVAITIPTTTQPDTTKVDNNYSKTESETVLKMPWLDDQNRLTRKSLWALIFTLIACMLIFVITLSICVPLLLLK